MIVSTEIEDRANAEVCRLGSLAWQEICALMSNASVDEFDSAVEQLLADVQKWWQDYLKTGIPFNDNEERVANALIAYHKNIQENLANSPTGPVESPEVAANPRKRKQKSEAQPTQEASKPLVDQEILDTTNPEAINALIYEIRYEVFGELDPHQQAIEDANQRIT